MLKLGETVLPVNRGKVDRYLSSERFHTIHGERAAALLYMMETPVGGLTYVFPTSLLTDGCPLALITSINPCQDSDHLLHHFQSYIDEEEKRLNTNLKLLKYEIDALNTLTLVTGPGRFERVRPIFRP